MEGFAGLHRLPPSHRDSSQQRKAASLPAGQRPAPPCHCRFLLVAKAIFSISLAVQRSLGFLGQRWLDCQTDLTLNWSAVTVKPRKSQFPAALCFLPLLTFSAVLLRTRFPRSGSWSVWPAVCSICVHIRCLGQQMRAAGFRLRNLLLVFLKWLRFRFATPLSPRSWSAAEVTTGSGPACRAAWRVGSVVCATVSRGVVGSVASSFLMH